MASQPYLDPLNQGLADATAAMPGMETLNIPDFRNMLMQFNAHEQLPGVERNMIQVPVANGTDTWIYTPEGAKGPLPYIFYVHGGAFVAGNISVYDSVATDLVMRTGYALVFPEFNLAPEAQWPEQQEQCFEVLEWMLQNGNEYNVVPDRFAIVADSAAADNPLSTTQGILAFNMNVFAQKKNLTIPYNVLLDPVASLDFQSRPPPSRYEFWDGPYLTVAGMRKLADDYVPPSVDRTSELASPMYVTEATARAFAPTLIVTSSADILRDEAEVLGQKLQQAGRDVAVFRAHGQIHDSFALEASRGGPTPTMIMTLVAAALKERLG